MADLADIPADTTCSSLLRELQMIWDEVGETDCERDKILLQLEQECLEVYRRKVGHASRAKALLRQEIADAEAEIASLVSILGARSLGLTKCEKVKSTLREQLEAVKPQLGELRKKKEDRLKQILDVIAQTQIFQAEFAGSDPKHATASASVDENDLSEAKLEECRVYLHSLVKEKAARLQKLSDCINSIQNLCNILAMDFKKIVTEVHPSLGDPSPCESKSISDETLSGLNSALELLLKEQKQRLRRLQDLGASLVELWTLLDISPDEHGEFQHITSVIGAHENEISISGALSMDHVKKAEAEVHRLEQLKASKMRELVMKKQAEIDDIYKDAHMVPDPDSTEEKIVAIFESGLFDASELLECMDKKLAAAKEEALSRREILEKLEKWMSACEEEIWLEEYNRDENRYSATRGAHINLKRAERARITIQKLPAMMEALITKTKTWEDKHCVPFLYDGMRLLEVLDDHNKSRKEKEQEKRKLKDQKKLQGQLAAEQGPFFGSRQSPHKTLSAKKGLSVRANGNTPTVIPNRRLSMGTALLHTDVAPKKNGVTPVRAGKDGKERPRPCAPVNYVSLSKEE